MSGVIEYKFALLGDSSVGKTTIFKKISTGIFSEHNISTIGTDKRTIDFNDVEVNIKGKKVKKSFQISLFDTAGQERFKSITKNYFKDADGIILLYDITNKITFDHVETWLASIEEVLSDWKTHNYLILLMGNKLDLATNGEKDREVNIEDVNKKYGDSGIILGGECSAKDFSDEQFLDIFKDLAIKIFDKVGEKVNKQHSKKVGKYKKKSRFCKI
jgi:Ras-related protein Rab-1A